MSKLKQIAEKDATKWARAEMFFGDGAGTRRKLLHAEIEDKMARIPGYTQAFDKFYSKQNMADHAIKAAKERTRIDRRGTLNKTAKAIVTGRHKSAPWIVGAYLLAHQYGYDKVVIAEGKAQYYKAKIKVQDFREDLKKKREETK